MANIANIIGKLSGIITALGDIKDAINNGGGGGSVTASNVSVVPTSPFVSTNLQNLSVEEANAITANAGDITTINTALGNTSISGIGDGSVTGAISSIDGDVNTIETALGNTSISGIGDGSVTGAISTLNNSIDTLENKQIYPTAGNYITIGYMGAQGTSPRYEVRRAFFKDTGTGARNFDTTIPHSYIINVDFGLEYNGYFTSPYYTDASDWWNAYMAGSLVYFRGGGAMMSTSSTLYITIDYIVQL